MSDIDKIKIVCPQCSKEFKEPAAKIRGGSSLTCPHCRMAVSFEEHSPHEGIRKALSAARRARRLAG